MPLKIDQSVASKVPVAVAEELGICKFKVPAERVRAKLEPVVLLEVVIAACLAFQVAAEAMRPSAKVPVQEGLKVQVAVPQTTLNKMFVSEVVAIVMEGEAVAVPPAIKVVEAICAAFKVLPDHTKLVPAVIWVEGVLKKLLHCVEEAFKGIEYPVP